MSNDEFHQALMYTGIDLGVELLVFGFTIVALRYIFPELNPWRILSGLLKMHAVSISMLMCVSWMGNLLFQSTYSGMDPLFRFEWLACKDNATRLGLVVMSGIVSLIVLTFQSMVPNL